MNTSTETRPKLAQELETWAARKDELLQAARGKFVVIYGADVIGIFDAEADAYETAYRQLGNVPFLLRQVQEQEKTYFLGGSSL